MAHYELYQQTKDKNLFEEIVDKLVLDDIPGMTDIFKQKILSLDRDKKRMAILSLLDKDRNLFLKIKALFDKNINRMEHIKDIVTMLREYVKVGEVEKKKFGEVMTPLDLIKEMISKLPKSVWSNPNLKWLDPCNGAGPFSSMITFRLMKGLSNVIPDEEKRYKHIVENMIYVCELQPKNMFVYLCTMDTFDSYKLNVYCGSFLDGGFDYHMKNVWGVEKFDIILGNPPYQQKLEENRKTKPLWNIFVFKALTILNEDGFLNMIHPSGWRNIDGVFKNIQTEFKNRNLLFLKMHTVQDGEKVFGATTSFDFYVLQNNQKYVNTEIVDTKGETNKIDISKLEIIPNFDIEKILKFFANDSEEKVQVLYSRSIYGTDKKNMQNTNNDEFIYPCVYSVLKSGKFNLFYSNENKGQFGVKKIICGNGANPTFFTDDEGRYGLTQFSFGIVDDENFDLIVDILKSGKQSYITEATKFISTNGNPIMYPKIVSLFKKDFWKYI